MKRTILLLIAAVLLIGVIAQQAASQSVQEKNKALVKTVYEKVNANKWDDMSNYIAENFIDHDPDPRQKPGLQGVKETFEQYHKKTFPDLKFAVQEIFAEGDLVCTRIAVTGTNKGEFMGMKATGKKFSVQGFDLMRIQNGKAVERWGTFDSAAMMMQLGMMKPPGQAAGGKAEKKK